MRISFTPLLNRPSDHRGFRAMRTRCYCWLTGIRWNVATSDSAPLIVFSHELRPKSTTDSVLASPCGIFAGPSTVGSGSLAWISVRSVAYSHRVAEFCNGRSQSASRPWQPFWTTHDSTAPHCGDGLRWWHRRWDSFQWLAPVAHFWLSCLSASLWLCEKICLAVGIEWPRQW